MRAEHGLERLGGVADYATLRRLSSRARIRAAVLRGTVIRDGRGLYALPGADAAVLAANRLTGVLGLDSAARQHGWETKHRPRRPVVLVPRNRHLIPERRAGVQVLFADLEPHDVDGIATSYERTVADCAARMPFDEALAIADSALRHGHVTKTGLVTSAEAMPDRYRARSLRVAQSADGRAANPFESVLRAIALDVPGLSVEPQVWVADVGRPDLVDTMLRLVVEADSFEFHGLRRALKRDCERYNAFVVAGWLVVRFTWEHVMFEPDYVRAVLTAMVELLTRKPQGHALAPGEQRLSA